MTTAPAVGVAGAVLVGIAPGQRNGLVVDNVLLAGARSSAWLRIRRNGEPLTQRVSVLAASARIASSAQRGATVHVGDHSVIEQRVVADDGVSIGAHCRVEVGRVVRCAATIGNRVAMGTASWVGTDGFAVVRDGRAWCAMPRFGHVVIADDVTMLAQVVNRAGG